MAPPSRGVRLAIDVAIAGWLIAWIVLGIAVAHQVKQLGDLSDTAVLAGQAIQQTADVLDQIGRIPLVGTPVGDLADSIRKTGQSAEQNGVASRDDVNDLSVLLGLSIALIPTIPLAAVWIPLRIRWRKERQAVKRALASGSPDLERLLAERARTSLPLDQVLALESDRKALAHAELDRLGLRAP
jgi:hypothetical protein